MQAFGAIVVSVAVLSGCASQPGESPDQSNGPLNMMVSAGGSGDTFIALAKRFTAETGIQVNVRDVPINDTRQQQILEISTGSSALDVITVNDAWLSNMFSNLEDIGAWMDKDGWSADHIVPSMKDLFVFDGKQYALPSRVGGRLLVYREDLLKAAGFDQPPATWDEFAKYAKALNDPANNVYGAGLTLGQTDVVDVWSSFLVSNGGTFVIDGELAIGSDASIKAAQEIADLYGSGLVANDSIEYSTGELITALQQGRVAMGIVYSPWLSSIADPKVSPFADQFRVAPRLPGVTGSDKSWISGWGFGINKASKHKDAAWKFVKYATDPDVQAWLALEHNNDPVVSSVFEDAKYLAARPEAPNVISTISDAERLPAIEGWSDVYLALGSVLSSIVVGDVTAASAMPQAARDLQKLLE